MRSIGTLAVVALLATGALAQQQDQKPVPSPTTETLMPAAPTFTIAKWQGRLYGFAEFDGIYDSTQSYSEIQGNGAIAKPGTMGGDNGRLQLSARNTRIGFNLESPRADNGIKGTGNIEGDFFGFDPAPFNGANSVGNSEASFYNNPTFRIRHAFVKIETPVVDIIAGQTWELFGWQGGFQPASVELQGIPGEVYSRTLQVRVTKAVSLPSSALTFAVAASRPPQRDSGLPDFQAGIKFDFTGWQGWKGTGGASNSLTNLQIGVSGLLRQFKLLNGASTSTTPSTDTLTGSGSAFSVNALIPIIPATKTSKANALTLVGEWTRGRGYVDVFTGLSGGATTVVPGTFGTAFTPNVDGGLIGIPGDDVVGVEWRSALVNLQYYTPIADGAVWLSGIYSDVKSLDIRRFKGAWDAQKYYSGNLFVDPVGSLRIGLSISRTEQTQVDLSTRSNVRGQLSFWYLFI
jgi:hypothetical protein